MGNFKKKLCFIWICVHNHIIFVLSTGMRVKRVATHPHQHKTIKTTTIMTIETFTEIARNWKHTGDYSPMAQRFMYDLSTLKGSKIWRDREAADLSIKKLKEFYLLDANATIDELENEIASRFNQHKVNYPNWYKQTEYSRAFEKLFQKI